MLKKQNKQLRIKLFEAVRDIPYYLGDNKTNASCGAKAKLLGEILGKIGLKCRLIYCYFNWDDTKIPKEITRKAPHKQAMHILLKVYIPERKKWIFVDPTWDNKLAAYLKISKWNGVSNTTIAVPTKRFFYLKDRKGKLISCQKFQARNFNPKEHYTKNLNDWLKKIENKTYYKENHMKRKNTHVFIAGGGSEKDSRSLDECFAKKLDRTKPLVYIPNAKQSRRYRTCFKWFKATMAHFGITYVEIWEDLRCQLPVTAIAGIYIGGGDTAKLLRELCSSDFEDYIREAVRRGVPLYGGSAGAIILGENIRTAPEAKDLNVSESRGLKIIHGYSIVCHYNGRKKAAVRQMVQKFGHDIIAIPEKAGGYISDNVFTSYGTKPISIFQADTIVCLEPNHSIKLSTK